MGSFWSKSVSRAVVQRSRASIGGVRGRGGESRDAGRERCFWLGLRAGLFVCDGVWRLECVKLWRCPSYRFPSRLGGRSGADKGRYRGRDLSRWGVLALGRGLGWRRVGGATKRRRDETRSGGNETGRRGQMEVVRRLAHWLVSGRFASNGDPLEGEKTEVLVSLFSGGNGGRRPRPL